MRIVQTFWSGGKSPLVDSFGWLKPEYNLMSWALSCLNLKKYYDEVVLYTDSIGYDILVNRLKLPYSDVIVKCDDFKCNQSLWAYPKVLTYSIQDKPFIHVDGDVYIGQKFTPEIESAGLIAQNREIGTSYYKGMIDAMRKEPLVVPDYLEEELNKESISSYNAGIIGGNDLTFIKKYCETAFRYIKDNRLDEREGMFINHNILFEQILFYVLSEEQPKKEISTVLDFRVNDNGYTYNQFCDLTKLENGCKFLHILGGHKRREKNCNLLERTLLKNYPEYFFRIINLFSHSHKRFHHTQNTQVIPSTEIKEYDDFVKKLAPRWNEINIGELTDIDAQSCNYFKFLQASKEEKLSTLIKAHPHINTWQLPVGLNADVVGSFKDRIDKDFYSNKFDIACIPDLLGKGYKEVLIDDLSYNILGILKNEKSLKDLLEILSSCFGDIEIDKDRDAYFMHICSYLENLFYHKLLFCE